MKLIDLRPGSAAGAAGWQNELDRCYEPAPGLAATVAGILDEVRRGGDSALFRYSKEFDRVDLTETGFRVREEEIQLAFGHLDPQVKNALETARANVQEFAFQSRRTGWMAKNRQGATVGERFDPFPRVGIYVPAGTAP